MSEPREELPQAPAQRSPRHAAPRTPVRVRLRGRALAMAAVPTALLMAAAYTPNPAIAESTAGKPCATAPDTVPQAPAPAETPVPKSELPPPVPGPSVPLPGAPATAAPAPAGDPAATPAATPTTAPEPGAPEPGATAPATTAAARTTDGGGVVRAGLIDDLVGGITHLVTPGGTASPTATAGPSTGARAAAPAPTAEPPAPTVTPTAAPSAPSAPGAEPTGTPAGTTAPTPPTTPGTTAPTAPATPTASTAPAGPKTSGTPSASAKPSAAAKPTASGSPSATASKDPNCLVDTKALAPNGKPADNPILVPDQNWTLQTTRLALNHAVLLGVVDVRSPTGTKRVLKFEVESVDIENLHMSTLQGNGKTFHVKGGPGSVSTMRKGPVTMYVERLSGHLAKVLGLPVPIDLGELTLTPDGPLPQWLYDLIGQLQVPLWIELTGVTAIQSGQFGGTLKIPGMRLYNDDLPYPGNA
ncbi:hypothetical protein ACFXAF_06900 [Kitasatospora sp. NPDC059463]|uniref:hypothetical protein n=1 Tax=unclassified Kitasatospora TaxID=2633591 RepID=UPI00368BF33F